MNKRLTYEELEKRIRLLEKELTQHKQAEEKIKEKATFMRILFEDSPDGNLIIDPKTSQFLDFNGAAHQQLGYSREEFAQLRIIDVEAKETAAETMAHIAEVIQRGKSDFETLQRTKQGELRNVHVSARIIKVQEHSVYYCVWRDHTERKRMEETLRKSEENFRKIFHTNQDSIGVNNLNDGTYIMINEGFKKFTGYTEADVIGRTALDINIWLDLEARARLLEGLKRDGKVDNLDAKFRHKDGNIGYGIMSASVIELNGNPYVLHVTRSITDRKQAEERLRQSEAKYRILVENAVEAIFIIQDGLMKFVNAEMARIFGYSMEDLVSRPFTDFIHPEDRESVLNRYLDRRCGKEAPSKYAIRLLDASGETRWVEVNAVFVEWEGQPASLNFMNDITSRKQAEEALRESENKFRKIFHTNQDAISITRLRDGMYNLINGGFTKLTGYTETGLVGKTISDIDIWENPADRNRLFEEIRREGKVVNFESNFRRKDGNIRIGNMSASILDLEGVPHLLSVTRDITDQKLAQKKQRESEEKYRILMENATESIHISQDGMMKYVNAASVKIFGYSKEELLSKPFTEFIYPDDRALVLNRHIERQKGSALPPRYSYRIMNGSGETRWVELQTVLVEWEGKPATLNFLSDITSHKSAEMELERARDFIENVEDACYEVDLNGKLIFCNEAFLKVSGYTSAEYKALSLWDRHPTREEAIRILNIYKEVYRTGIPAKSVEHYGLCKDGSVRISEVSISLIRDKSGNPTGFRGVGNNITERKKQEEQRKQLEERLQRAEKMEALGTLAGGVAHDLNNVMGIVLGYAELLMYSVNEADPLRTNLVNILDAGRRAAAIVQDLLTLARRGVYNRQVFNLNKIVSASRKTPEFEMLCTFHPDVEIDTDLEPDLLNISGSAVHLGKALFNLVSNASEAMPNGGKVTIRTANRYLDRPVQGYDQIREGDYVVLTVSDTGGGISKSDLKHIFEPFYTKKVMGRSGTGLGLAVVWGTVKDHHGYINVQSEVGKGSRFTLYFPVTREEIKPESVSVPMSEYMGSCESILVVDDIKGQRELAAGILRKLNYRVACVAGGEEAVARLKDHPADLLILDMIMDTGMDGLDTYRAVLKINPKQKAIIVSGFSESNRVHAAQELGAGAYIRKPYVIEKLGLAVKAELEKTRTDKEKEVLLHPAMNTSD